MPTKKIIVTMGEHTSYPLVVGMDLQKELLAAVKKQGQRRIAIITDSQLAKHWGAHVLGQLKAAGQHAELFSFPPGEKNKNQKTVTDLQQQLLKKHYGRDTLIIALGGGVVGDLVGFVAATYLRGVPYIQMPTSLLAMVDSSIGGKVGIDTPYGKNTIGAFYQPRAVIMDLAFLEKLPRLQMINGLLEAIKTFFTSDKVGLPIVSQIDLDHPLKAASALQEVVWRSVRIKAGITSRDETEKNERRLLNFGHTIGHAVELLSGFTIPHGFAVGYGMLVEIKIAELLGLLSSKDAVGMSDYLSEFGITNEPLKHFSVSQILKTTKTDKKVIGGKSFYVLLERVGSVYKKNGQFAHPVSDDVVKEALQSLLSF